MDQKINNILQIKNFHNQSTLQQEIQFNNQIREEIILEKFKSKKIEKQLSANLGQVEEQGILLASQLQIEMQKNKKLMQLVDNLKQRIQQSKRNNSEKLRNNIENLQDELPSLIKRQKKIQYDLQQLIQKHNQTMCQINKNIEIVNSARSQRVVYSGVFKNIQKQLFDAQIQYKKLLIQKVYCTNRLKQQESLFKKIIEESNKNTQKLNEVHQNVPILKTKLFDDKFEKSEQKPCLVESLNVCHVNQQPNSTIKQAIVKRILLDLQCQNMQQLIYKLHNNQQDNKSYEYLLNLDQKISQVQDKLKVIKSKKQNLRVISNNDQNEDQKIKNLKNQRRQFIKKIKQQRYQLFKFKQSTQKLHKILKIQKRQNEQNSCTEYFQLLDQKLTNILPKSKHLSQQPKQTNKQIMMKLNQMMNKPDKITDPMKLLQQNDIIKHCEEQFKKTQKIIKNLN